MVHKRLLFLFAAPQPAKYSKLAVTKPELLHGTISIILYGNRTFCMVIGPIARQ